jgi:TonB family protein
MIRLFAPPTPTPALPRTGVTLGNLLLHVALILAMAVPLEQEVRRALLDREVIYLVPLARAAGPELERGDLPWESAAAAAAGVTQQARAAEAPTGGAPAQGAHSELSVPNLKPAFLTTRVLQETAVTELEVDSAVIRDPLSAAPAYPPALLQKAIGGSVTVRYVVDTLGSVDPLTYLVIAMSHPEFARAVWVSLPDMRFRPAVQKGRRVRQWVEQTFQFRIVPRDTQPPEEGAPFPA